MTSPPTMTAARLGWISLGASATLAFLEGPSLIWYVLLSRPWSVGAITLWHPAPSARAARALAHAAASPVAVAAAAITGGLLMALALVLTVGGALFVAVWVGAAVLVVGTRVEPTRFVSAWTVGTVFLALLGCVFGLFEVLFQSKPLALRFGSPRELAAWEQRYDRLWERNALGFVRPTKRRRRRRVDSP